MLTREIISGFNLLSLAGFVVMGLTLALNRTGAHAPKMMSIGLHLRIIGRPGRISALDRILRHITNRGDAWIARRVDIANHWLAQFPSGGSTCPHL